MINQRYRLVSERQFEGISVNENIGKDTIIVRPLYLSICVADQRYFTFTRDEKVLKQKLPMALIHEAVGEVMYDATGKFKVGQKVIIIPNTPVEENKYVAENYLRSSKFRASGFDGFTQELVFTEANRILPINDELNTQVAAFIELISVAMHSLTRFEARNNGKLDQIGVWGDGNLGYILTLLLKHKYPNSKITVFGKSREKLNYFSFADSRKLVDDDLSGISIDQAFECCGGFGSQEAIEQIIDMISPEGTIAILGVSEHPIPINTRMVLEKGLNIYGSSRSGRDDFEKTISILEESKEIVNFLESLISEVIEVNEIKDLVGAFEKDLNNSWGKTIIKWNI